MTPNSFTFTIVTNQLQCQYTSTTTNIPAISVLYPAFSDADNDGDMDIITNNTDDFAGVYRNNAETITKNNFLKIKLKGDKGNSMGIGAKVYFDSMESTVGFPLFFCSVGCVGCGCVGCWAFVVKVSKKDAMPAKNKVFFIL